MLSIIIPVLNWIWYTKQILKEIEEKTKWEYEILLLISWYDTETGWLWYKHAILNKDAWVNGAWNEWVNEAKWEYIAVINNDLLLDDWRDIKLIEWLKDTKLTFPAYTYWDKPWKVMYENRFGNNICWRCFVMRKSDWREIPKWIKIWFWDNYIYEYLKWDYKCINDCVIHHFESKTITNMDFVDIINARILEDKKNWFKIKKNIWN